MKFRYFILQGDSLNAYLESEKKEMAQVHNVADVLLKQRDDIESYRPSRQGGVDSIIFKPGKQPPGMIRASKQLPANEVRPHAKDKAAAPFRELLAGLRVTESCQKVIVLALKLPTFICGPHTMSRSGMALYTSRVGHVGPHVIVEIPVANENSENPADKTPYPGHPDLKEIQMWEYVKMFQDFKDFKAESEHYVLKLRE